MIQLPLGPDQFAQGIQTYTDYHPKVMIPELYQVTWPHPNFIGLSGCLDRVRFAVDPTSNQFYFGAIV